MSNNTFSPAIGSAASPTEIAIVYQSSTPQDYTMWVVTSSTPEDPDSWSFTHVPNLLTFTGPALAFFNGSFTVLTWGTQPIGNTNTFIFSLNLSTMQYYAQGWLGPTLLPPALAVFDSNLGGVFVPQAGNNTMQFMQSTDGQSWNSNPLPPALTTTAAPAAAAFDGYFYVLFQSSTDQTLFTTKSNNCSDENSWDLNHLPAAITSSASPSLTTMSGVLYAAFQSSSSDNTIYISKSTDGVNWDLHQLPLAITTQSAPTIVTLNGQLYVIYQSSTDNTLWLISSSDGVNWSGLTHLPVTIGTKDFDDFQNGE